MLIRLVQYDLRGGNKYWIKSTEITKVAADYKSPKTLAAIQAAVERQLGIKS